MTVREKAAKLTPRHDSIIVLPLASASRTPEGMVIPDIAGDRPQTGLVLAVGPGQLQDDGSYAPITDLQPGDIVFYGKFAGIEFPFEGLDLTIMRDREAGVKHASEAIVEHDDPGNWHLASTPCEICLAPAEEAAKSNIERMRAELVAGKNAAPSTVNPEGEKGQATE